VLLVPAPEGLDVDGSDPLVPAPPELSHEMAADEPSGAGDKDELARVQFHSGTG
jgi:hypothetical protein